MVAAGLVLPASASAVTLHDQFNDQATGTGSATPSYFYEDGTGDEQAADDFTVPPGQAWQITNVQVPGPDLSGTFTFRSIIYSDTGTMPGSPLFQGQGDHPARRATGTPPIHGAP